MGHDLGSGTLGDTALVLDLETAVREAGASLHGAAAGAPAFGWGTRPEAFVLLLSGHLSVRFATRDRAVPWAECRAVAGQDCMPVTAAILSDVPMRVQATCLARTRWLCLPPASLMLLVHGHAPFRRALFAQHARRLPHVFSRSLCRGAARVQPRLADWLLGHAEGGQVSATHRAIAADLLTAREVVSRALRDFATRGWIVQTRGRIVLAAPEALAQVARDPGS
ncbi:MAG: Crp/Fnr family transcriptional regulator [Pseudomonadota bacterium]